MTLLIDADWLIYSSCCACEQDIRWDTNLHTLHADERDVHEMIDGRTAHYQALAEDKEDVVMCFTQYPTFRHTIYPEYKANRKHKRKPLGLSKIIEQTKERYQVESYEGLEGDDVMAILATSKKYPDPIIVSVDKDMRSVPCTLLAGDDLELITRRKANRHWMIQALTGDSTDNYFGIDKVGPVTAEKILGDAKTLEEMWEKVVAAYEKKKYNFADAVLNAQLARILRDGDFDFQTGEVSLWTP